MSKERVYAVCRFGVMNRLPAMDGMNDRRVAHPV